MGVLCTGQSNFPVLFSSIIPFYLTEDYKVQTSKDGECGQDSQEVLKK
jgi:hypothetical protein